MAFSQGLLVEAGLRGPWRSWYQAVPGQTSRLPRCLWPSLHITSNPTPHTAAFLMTLACVVLMTADRYAWGRARPARKEGL